MKKNELVPQLDGTFAVKRNGVVLHCPFAPPIVIPGPTGLNGQPVMNIQRLSCSTGCPLANVDQNVNDQILYQINCGKIPQVINCGPNNEQFELR